MISSEVQRTLVKSPPELWAELSDPAALARHLGELGEIKITKTEPEQTVEWEAEAVKGKVQLKPSGWGTRVTLSVTQELPGGSEADGETEGLADAAMPEAPAEHEEKTPADATPPRSQAESQAEAPADATAPDPQAAIAAEPAASEPAETDDATPEVAGVEHAVPRRGFFARLFRRKAKVARANAPIVENAAANVEAAAAAETDALPAEAIAAAGPPAGADADLLSAQSAADVAPAIGDAEQTGQPETGRPGGEETETAAPADLAAELAAAEEALVAQTTEMLTSVLDRLGAAHHRPFSRG